MKLNYNFDYKQLLKDRKFKYGGAATILTIVLIGIIIFINLIVAQLDWKVDLTENKMFTLSEQTNQILDNLNRDVTIYGLYTTGNENRIISEILTKYSSRSNKVKVEYIDPLLNPQFVNQYEGTSSDLMGSVIIESKDKYRIITPQDFINISYDQYYQPQADSLAVEQRISSAIHFVSSDYTPIIYQLVGHEQRPLFDNIKQIMTRENYEIKDLDLLTAEEVPKDAEIIIINGPQRDLSDNEDQLLRDYLRQGGRVIILLDHKMNELSNFKGLLNSYGLNLEQAIIIEGNPGKRLNNPLYLVPEMKSHEILSPLVTKRSSVIIPVGYPLNIMEARRDTLEIKPLLLTSNNSWAKTESSVEGLNKEPGDLEGPFNLAAMVTDNPRGYAEKPAKLLVVANYMFLNPEFSRLSREANTDFFMNSLSYLQEQQESIYIRPTSLKGNVIEIKYLQQLIVSGIVVILIPVLVFLTGVIVWMRRKNL